MSKPITVTHDDIFHQIKISGQASALTEQVVKRNIITSTADDLGIKVELEELQQAADNIRLINKLVNAEDTWAWLRLHSLSIDDFEQLVFINLITKKLTQHLFADEVEPYFFKHRLDYSGALMYEVVLDDEDLAFELFYSLQEEDISFFEIAHRYIKDDELRRCGGYKGIVGRKQIKAEIRSAVFDAKPPQILQPIVTYKGVHLIFVEDLIEPDLTDKLRYQILLNLFEDWIDKKVKDVDIVKKFD